MKLPRARSFPPPLATDVIAGAVPATSMPRPPLPEIALPSASTVVVPVPRIPAPPLPEIVLPLTVVSGASVSVTPSSSLRLIVFAALPGPPIVTPEAASTTMPLPVAELEIALPCTVTPSPMTVRFAPVLPLSVLPSPGLELPITQSSAPASTPLPFGSAELVTLSPTVLRTKTAHRPSTTPWFVLPEIRLSKTSAPVSPTASPTRFACAAVPAALVPIRLWETFAFVPPLAISTPITVLPAITFPWPAAPPMIAPSPWTRAPVALALSVLRTTNTPAPLMSMPAAVLPDRVALSTSRPCAWATTPFVKPLADTLSMAGWSASVALPAAAVKTSPSWAVPLAVSVTG